MQTLDIETVDVKIAATRQESGMVRYKHTMAGFAFVIGQ
jgi:hypothetical protein